LILPGLNTDANLLVLNEEKYAIPYILANLDYDVWIANFRGAVDSRGHSVIDIN
jgi:hypothetical protein